MGMYGGDVPDPDPAVGEAAKENAQIGRDYLDWMKKRSRVTDRWARQDRRRDFGTFRPLQNRFIETARTWASPGRTSAAAREATADVIGEMNRADEQTTRQLTAMGVKPNAGRSASELRSRSVERGLAVAGAKNMARRGVRNEALGLQGQAINLGSGLAVNPLSAFTAGTSASGQGFEGAMQGNDSAGRLLLGDYQARLQAQQAQQQGIGDLFGAIGMGAGLMFGSDEKTKTKKRKARGMLDAVRKMRADEWEYRPDAPLGDGGGKRHVGTYAGDFRKATGLGDGKTIPAVDAVGVNLGAVKELDENQQKLEKRLGGIERGIKRLEKAV